MTPDELTEAKRLVSGHTLMNRYRMADLFPTLLAAYEAQQADLESIRQAVDAVAPIEDRDLVQAVKDEMHDYAMVIGHCSEIYCHFTSSRISKPNTLPCEVIAVAAELEEERAQEVIDDATEDLRDKFASLLVESEVERQKARDLRAWITARGCDYNDARLIAVLAGVTKAMDTLGLIGENK